MLINKFEASFPMYDYPETREASNEFWKVLGRKLKDEGINAPKSLTRPKNDMEHWNSTNMLVSQTCGYPYRKFLSEKVHLIGIPDLRIDNIPPGYYQSVLVVKKDKEVIAKSGEILAFNNQYSQSGWMAPKIYVQARNIVFADCVETGGHWYSAQAFASGKVTLSAIDVFSWELSNRFTTLGDKLRVMDTTIPTPGFLLITACENFIDEIYFSVVETIEIMDEKILKLLPFKGLARLRKKDYLEVDDNIGNV